MKILKATYGGKDCTQVIKSKVKNDKLVIKADNSIIGDPAVGTLKHLRISYRHQGQDKETSGQEGSVVMVPETKTKRLGIFYTNNNASEKVIEKSLQSIQAASKKFETDIITSVWKPIPNNPFHEIVCNINFGNHFNVAYQISTLLVTASLAKDYETVSFLEHDVLYGEDYFDIKPFTHNVVCNDNYIGFRKQGFQKKIQLDEPLHELTVKFPYALAHFKNILADSIVMGVNLEPPHVPPYGKRNSKQSSVHINDGPHLTSHYNVFGNTYSKKHPYWGDTSELAKTLGL